MSENGTQTTTPSTTPDKGSGSKGIRHFLSDLFVRFFFFFGQLLRVIIISAVVFALVGAVSFLFVRQYIQGQEVLVPNITGKSVEEAAKTLLELQTDLSIKIEELEYNDLEPKGTIVTQFPQPDNSVKSGTVIRVRVSKGTTLVVCPDVRAMVEGEAGVNIRKAELVVGSLSSIYSEDIQKDLVIAQDPPPNSFVSRETRVNLLVSLGPEPVEYIMPDLRDLTPSEARILLHELDMSISRVHQSPYAGKDNGLIYRQNPIAGSPVSKQDEIMVEVVRNETI
ncbi:MAG: PASTA domain-containing protein [Candidatus Sumerlaeota bacterium]